MTKCNLVFQQDEEKHVLKLLNLVFPANRYSFIGLRVTLSTWAFLQPVGPWQ